MLQSATISEIYISQKKEEVMTTVKAFRAVRPAKEFAEIVSCLPYDVMDRDEAKAMASGNSRSYLRIVRSEIDLSDDISAYDECVYLKARENLNNFMNDRILIQDEKECFYIYEETMLGRTQTGICALCSVEDYNNGIIKRHEFTLPKKEIDRINNFLYCRAHTEPVFFIHKDEKNIDRIVEKYKQNEPVYDFVSSDDIRHRFWVVEDEDIITDITSLFEKMPEVYIADGHHRTASSAKVSEKVGGKDAGYIMAVIFPESQVKIMDYNRLLMDTGEYTGEEFIAKLNEDFIVKEKDEEIYTAKRTHEFAMYMDNKWYSLTPKDDTFDENDPVGRIDAQILQDLLFDKILGIKDPKTTDRLKFVGGIRGYGYLREQVDDGKAAAAIAVYPVEVKDLLSVADAGMVMPPKSTWFEPKLRSGLFLHLLDDQN